MDKRYQVFLSSTYADLKDERQKVMQTLMEMDCIPSGMELFPAMDEEQFNFIKKVIDDCDYYLLIIGGRYGSLTEEGISYTQLEYEYAVNKGLKVIAFLHQDPDSIPVGKTDKDPNLLKKLNDFRAEVEKNRLVKYWKAAEELPGLVALSLSKTIKTYPSVGWVRGTASSNSELLEEINILRKENSELFKQKSELEAKIGAKKSDKVSDIAGLDETIKVFGSYKTRHDGLTISWEENLTWSELFMLMSPYLLSHPNEARVNSTLAEVILEKKKSTKIYSGKVNEDLFQTLKIQFMALDLIKISYATTTAKTMALFWSLTEKGNELMVQVRSVKSLKATA